MSAEPIAALDLEPPLNDRELMPLVQMKKSKFYALKKQGWWKFLELNPQPTAHTLYSRYLVTKWLRGELRRDVPVAAPPPRRFFGAAAAKAAAPKRAPGRPRTGNQSGPVLVRHDGQSALTQTER